jgi:UDP-N-acetyl-D-glucosamine dehydrogenase
LTTRFIELAGEINASMPGIVVGRVAEELSRRFRRSVSGSRILLVGLAYKKNVDDIRESPGFRLVELLERRGAQVDYHDPFIARVPTTRDYADLSGRCSVPLAPQTIASYDAVLIATDHDCVDYDMLLGNAKLVVDTRNVVGKLGRASDANVCRA